MDTELSEEVVAKGVELAIRRIMEDEELKTKFWKAGFDELSKHATNQGSQWVGKRLLTGVVTAGVTAGLIWLIKAGHFK